MGETVSDQLVPASASCELTVDFFEVFGMWSGPSAFFFPVYCEESKCFINQVESFLRIKINMVHFHFFCGRR